MSVAVFEASGLAPLFGGTSFIPPVLLPDHYSTELSRVFSIEEAFDNPLYQFVEAAAEKIEGADRSALKHLTAYLLMMHDDDNVSPPSLLKTNGYISRLFSDESWDNWLEPRSALGQVADAHFDYVNGSISADRVLKNIDSTTIQKAASEALEILQNRLRNEFFKEVKKYFQEHVKNALKHAVGNNWVDIILEGIRNIKYDSTQYKDPDELLLFHLGAAEFNYWINDVYEEYIDVFPQPKMSFPAGDRAFQNEITEMRETLKAYGYTPLTHGTPTQFVRSLKEQGYCYVR